ncbi:tyrosine-type recombinase/integrase [Tepidamorphus sp. 3E244]|uniref:tyrosine-type recombinase/integrase n=1 Tax=Tepidamorphus sp. 3E244 TaxID=3385498 RepID=UPI0038FC984E
MVLTQRSAASARPQAKESYIWDAGLKGFALKITPKGRKVFLVQYRAPDATGRTRRITLGKYGDLTVEEARRQAKKLLAELALGKDPATEKRAERKRKLTLNGAIDQFLEQHVEPKRATRTAAEYRRLIDQDIRVVLGTKTVNTVTHADVARLHTAMSKTPYAANRAIAVLSKFFNWCEVRGLRNEHSNPCRHIEKYREQARNRFLSSAELTRLGVVLQSPAVTGKCSVYVVAAIRLLSLTGARLNEILTMEWSFVDLEHRQLRLPRSKTGARTIHLNDAAIDVLRSIPRIDGNPYVVCGTRNGQHLVNLQKPWQHIRTIAELDDVRIHDLRHSYAAVAASSGLSLPMIGALLGHTQAQTTKRYAHLADDPLKEANERIGGTIHNLMN